MLGGQVPYLCDSQHRSQKILFWLLLSLSVNITSMVRADCLLPEQTSVTDPYYQPKISLLDPAACCQEAKQNILARISSRASIEEQTSADARQKARSISAEYGKGGIGIDISGADSESSAASVTYRGVTWSSLSRGCSCSNVRVKEGDDRGWGQGRAGNGYCSADVTCKFQLYTPQLPSCDPPDTTTEIPPIGTEDDSSSPPSDPKDDAPCGRGTLPAECGTPEYGDCECLDTRELVQLPFSRPEKQEDCVVNGFSGYICRVKASCPCSVKYYDEPYYCTC